MRHHEKSIEKPYQFEFYPKIVFFRCARLFNGLPPIWIGAVCQPCMGTGWAGCAGYYSPILSPSYAQRELLRAYSLPNPTRSFPLSGQAPGGQCSCPASGGIRNDALWIYALSLQVGYCGTGRGLVLLGQTMGRRVLVGYLVWFLHLYYSDINDLPTESPGRVLWDCEGTGSSWTMGRRVLVGNLVWFLHLYYSDINDLRTESTGRVLWDCGPPGSDYGATGVGWSFGVISSFIL